MGRLDYVLASDAPFPLNRFASVKAVYDLLVVNRLSGFATLRTKMLVATHCPKLARLLNWGHRLARVRQSQSNKFFDNSTPTCSRLHISRLDAFYNVAIVDI